MSEKKFFVCEHCGNLVEMINDTGVPMMCCGQKMTELKPGTVDASYEKHIPVVSVDGKTVKVDIGAVAHPMVEEHSILWVVLQTDKGSQIKYLQVDSEPTVTFALADETPVAAYAYCNLHGLWMAKIESKSCCANSEAGATVNHIVCNCNNVSYFDILDAVHKHNNVEKLLDVFEDVKDTTKCSTGCGGCYDKVMNIISEAMNGAN